jgi:hypothetical protein
MAFPISPTNGQTATVNGITYAYTSATNSWKKVTSSVGNLTITNNLTVGTQSVTGNLTVGNVITGIVTASANITANNVVTGIVTASGNITAANVTTSGNVRSSYYHGDGSKLTNTMTTGKAIAMSIVFGG